MHSELRTLMKAGRVLLQIEDKLADNGVRAARQDYGYAHGVFGESYGDENGIALVWCVAVNSDSIHEGVEVLQSHDEDLNDVNVDIGVVVSLHFQGSSVFGVTYDTEDGEWYRYLYNADPGVEISTAAVAFAKTQEVTKLSAPTDRLDRISEERALEIVGAMGAYAKKHVPGNVIRPTPAATTAIVKASDGKKPGGSKSGGNNLLN